MSDERLIVRDLSQKLGNEIHDACRRTLRLVDQQSARMKIATVAAGAPMMWLAASLCVDDAGNDAGAEPSDGPPENACWLAAFMVVRMALGDGDPIEQAYRDMEAWTKVRADAAEEITRLRSLLQRIDAVTVWETTPLGRGFQDEIEAALLLAERKRSRS